MIVNLFILFLLIFGTLPLINVLKKSFESVFPLTCMWTVVFLFFLGLIKCLFVGPLLLCLLFFISGSITLFLQIKNKKIQEFTRLLFTPGFAIFILFFFVSSYCNAGLLALYWDEFTHWLDITKVMVTINDFGTNPESHSYFQSYPPAMSLFQYFIEKIYILFNKSQAFNEWRAYFAYQIFTFSFFLPFFRLNPKFCVISDF